MRRLGYRLFLLFLLLFSTVAKAQPRILAVHSYHPDFFWIASLVKGIEKRVENQAEVLGTFILIPNVFNYLSTTISCVNCEKFVLKCITVMVF